MFSNLIKRIFGSRNQRVLQRLEKQVAKINGLEPSMSQLTNEQLRAKTDEFRQRIQSGATLEDLLPEAFAVVREASKRTLQMRHFDVQLIGGMVLHEGKIAEMGTGEGKTLVETLPAYLNALSGKGVHIITINDYLAHRDAQWMSPIYEFLGLTVGVILSQQNRDEKYQAYHADITYGTNNEFGFDYLRDNMAFSLNEKVQRELNFAIVDEVDSILIDEARTPLIISGPSEDSPSLYITINALIPQLKKQLSEEAAENGESGDYYLEEKAKQVYLTDEGHQKIEQILTAAGLLHEGESLYDATHITLMHHVMAALRAHKIYHRDVDYIVQNKQVVIVDEHTGRTMVGRRWSDGLHQAVEAKEGVPIQNENQTLASITFQNYFRLYQKLSGMTGTADTEAQEFQQIYNLEVIVIPTNKPMIRKDFSDQIYLTADEKFEAIIADIQTRHAKHQPILVGTASIETSEYLSQLLTKAKIPHQVLNAKYHEKEAHIIAQAGRPDAVTIATNMAGRGTDIVLGGSLEVIDSVNAEALKQDWTQRHAQVIAAGGLHIIGSERHESRRIDNQLRGRAARQGDPGSSRFYLSLQDNLMRIFASERVSSMMQRLGMERGEPLEHSFVTKTVEYAQRRVEGYHFDVRKQLLEYDDVANEQRTIIYEQRNHLLTADHIADTIQAIHKDVVEHIINTYIPPGSMPEQWDVESLQRHLEENFGIKLPIQSWLDENELLHEESLHYQIQEAFDEALRVKEAQIGGEIMRQLEKSIMLQIFDKHWREHLAAMDHLRQGIHLRGYAQKNPKQEYKREAFLLFSGMLDQLKEEVIRILHTAQVHDPRDVEAVEEQRRQAAEAAERKMHFQHPTAIYLEKTLQMEKDESQQQDPTPTLPQQPSTRTGPKIGRNHPCPCGSGKKYKQCHGQLHEEII